MPESTDSFVLTSSHWGALRVRSKRGAIAEVAPFEHDRDPTPVIQGFKEAFDHPNRIRRPCVRRSWLEAGVGAHPERRGIDGYVEVSWDQALDLVAAELHDARTRFGNTSIFAGSQGWSSAGRFHHAQTQLKRFLNCLGGFTNQRYGYSFAAAQVVLPHLVGDVSMIFGPSTSWQSILTHTRVFVSFGGLPIKNAQVLSGGSGNHPMADWLAQMKRRGIRVINVSPIRDDVPDDVEAQWVPIVPGTDTALLLAMAHTLLAEARYDAAFLERCTVGFEKVADYLRHGRDGAAFDAGWAARVTGVDAGTIRELARALHAERSFVNLTWSLQRADNGEQTYWAALTLGALLGQIGLPGGGVGFGYGSDAGTVGATIDKIKAPALPMGTNPAGIEIPASRVADLLLRPGEDLPFNGRTIRLPETRLVYWSGGNPFHHHQDINRLVRALRRPHAFVVNEQFWTAAARYADVVLPATTTLERNDLGGSSSSNYLMAMKQAVAPLPGVRNDHDIFRGLARRLGVLDAFTEGLDEMGWLRRMYAETATSARGVGIEMPDFDTFWGHGYFVYPEAARPFVSFAAFRESPSRHPLATPSGRIELFSATVAGFGYAESPGHAAWQAPREWLGAPLAARFPLHLLSNQPATRLHGQLDSVGESRKSKIREREPIRLHPDDAATRGIRDGDIVRVFNDRGACLAGAMLSTALRRGVVQLATGAWYSPVDRAAANSLDAHGNPNVLTHDLGTSRLTQGPAAQSCLVEVARFDGALPEVTVNMPPEIAYLV